MSDFNKKTILLSNNVDGEMSIHTPRLVMEAQSNTLAHVLYRTTDRKELATVHTISPSFVSLESSPSFQGDGVLH